MPRLSGFALRIEYAAQRPQCLEFPFTSAVNSAPRLSNPHLLFIFVFHSGEGTTFPLPSFNAGQGEESLRLALRRRAAQTSLPLWLLKSQFD